MIRILSVVVLVAAASAMFALSLPQADGCAAVRHRDGPSIHIAEESAIIVWDPVKKVQHFIRRAAFDTKSPDFGFLVPTRTMPEFPFEVVEDGIFRTMDTWLVPRTVEQTRWKFEPMMCAVFPGAMVKARMDMAPKSEMKVKVLGEQKVGGYDVKVLEADDAEALAKWIKEHGYSADPELYEWLTPYVAGKWKISAFKISQDPKTGQLATTKAVRMSFKTDRPFFPYREPESKKPKDDKESDLNSRGGRLLRVLFVSDMRMDAKLGSVAWHASIPWSDSLTDEQRQQLVKEIGVRDESVPAKAWLTTFEDRASPRPGKVEVYFDPAVERTPIRPPDIIKYNDVWIPLDCSVFALILIALIVIFVVWRVRKASAPAA
jgi:Uncharacterized protein conserved in bacteria (DUF2330)